MPAKRVLSVGQCSADHSSISHYLSRHFGAETVPVATADAALQHLGRERFDLVLVNRVFDYTNESGVSFIKKLRADAAGKNVPVMLVSNYADAQAKAVEAGALEGFGKSELGDETMLDRLRPLLDGE
jgi:two-component system, chemotaxis family, chemotaxis protein CheY